MSARSVCLEGFSPAALSYTVLLRRAQNAVGTPAGPAAAGRGTRGRAGRPATPPLLVVAPNDEEALRFAADLSALSGVEATVLEGEEASPFDAVSSNARAALARLALRQRLLQPDSHPLGFPELLVVGAAALQGTWMPTADFVAAQQTLVPGEDVHRDALQQKLLQLGYQRVQQVEDEGTFAVRGGTVDIFVPLAPAPLRLDLFGDELASIRPFHVDTQALMAPQPSLQLCPIRDVIYDDAHTERALAWLRAAQDSGHTPTQRIRELRQAIQSRQYFFGIEALWPAFYGQVESVAQALLQIYPWLVLTDEAACEKVWYERQARAHKERLRAEEEQGPQVETGAHVVAAEPLSAELCARAQVRHAPVWLGPAPAARSTLGDFAPLAQALAEQRKLAGAEGQLLQPLLRWLAGPAAAFHTVVLFCQNQGAALRLQALLQAHRVDLPIAALAGQLFAPPAGGAPRRAIAVGALSQGLLDAEQGLALISDVELFATERRLPGRRRRNKATSQGLSTLRDLRPKDLIIHQDHGIGRYEGLVRLVLDGVDGDFVHLTYADGDRLYVPSFRLGLLKRYHGSSTHAQLDKLGGPRWERAKRRVRDAVLAMAHTLLALEARRKSQKGFALQPPNEAYAAFAANFPYEETPDQKKAIEATLQDLQQEVPMDRLICGDVGFGKTEVALRAAFLAVEAGRQVAVLVPTTVLAEQHKETFAARLGPFGAQVESLSRFRSPKQAKEVLARLKDRQVDVLIGTHRLLGQDVQFANLGLLIVDEEQRFGVKHKERIKQLRAHVHVLTLSATPIPRTLHMATAGMRDLSLIQTPPLERSAIRTEVLRYDEEVLQEAIRRELHRGGQVFVVHNRIEGIEQVRATIERLVPEAKVALGHGQMQAHALEDVMVRFVRRAANVLICTAIIESGIDIPSVNTMVVLRADLFGLSQLYQLRGRIGRGKERAFAYLMLPDSGHLPKDVLARLGLLKRFSELGSGFQVASHDLELRGAGDLLGADQSGHIASVGFELYTQLLHEAVEKARGGGPRQDVEPDIKVAVAAVFPERYMPEPMDRLTFYQRLAEAQDDAQMYDVMGEVQQIFGPPPEEAQALVALMRLRRRLKELGATTLSAAVDAGKAPEPERVLRMGVTFAADAAVDRQRLVELCQAARAAGAPHFRLLPSGRLAVVAEPPPLQPACPERDQDVPYILGQDLLAAALLALAPLRVLAPVAPAPGDAP